MAALTLRKKRSLLQNTEMLLTGVMDMIFRSFTLRNLFPLYPCLNLLLLLDLNFVGSTTLTKHLISRFTRVKVLPVLLDQVNSLSLLVREQFSVKRGEKVSLKRE